MEITSKRNRFEADMVLKLAKYLILQGYKPSDITILATYKGQMYHMKNVSSLIRFNHNIILFLFHLGFLLWCLYQEKLAQKKENIKIVLFKKHTFNRPL